MNKYIQFSHQLLEIITNSDQDELLAKHSLPKVTQFDDAIFANENVLRFHISMEYAMRVEVKEGGDKLSSHAPHLIHPQVVIILKYLVQVAFSKFSHNTHLHTSQYPPLIIF